MGHQGQWRPYFKWAVTYLAPLAIAGYRIKFQLVLKVLFTAVLQLQVLTAPLSLSGACQEDVAASTSVLHHWSLKKYLAVTQYCETICHYGQVQYQHQPFDTAFGGGGTEGQTLQWVPQKTSFPITKHFSNQTVIFYATSSVHFLVMFIYNLLTALFMGDFVQSSLFISVLYSFMALLVCYGCLLRRTIACLNCCLLPVSAHVFVYIVLLWPLQPFRTAFLWPFTVAIPPTVFVANSKLFSLI